MSKHCDVSICINGEETFFLNEKMLSAHSGKLKKMIKQEKKNQKQNIPFKKNSRISMEIVNFPGGSTGFELTSRFCYNNGRIHITVSNICLLYCSAVFLDMSQTLLIQTESFLEGIFYWPLNDILVCLKSCAQHDSIFRYSDSCGLLQRLICAVLAKIAQNPDSNPGFRTESPTILRNPRPNLLVQVSCSSSSSPSSNPKSPMATPESLLNPPLAQVLASSTSSSSHSSPSSSSPTAITTATRSSSQKQWWFDDLSSLPPAIIEKLIKDLGSYGKENNSIILTRFILHYLKKKRTALPKNREQETLYGSLADTAIYGVIQSETPFSCRGLLRILKTVSGLGISKICRGKLEREIGRKIDEATVDDLLISGQERGDYYDVKLVLRLIRIFVKHCNDEENGEIRMKKVGKLIDKYMVEISPDHNLKMSKFLGVAQSLPDSARDCFDGVYKAIDIFLQSHPTLAMEERTKICEWIKYEKLSLEACKEMAKNPRIPPTVAIQALKSQTKSKEFVNQNYREDNEDMKINIERMQTRVLQLEKACKEMKSQMSSLLVTPTNFNNVFVSSFSSPTRALPRLC